MLQIASPECQRVGRRSAVASVNSKLEFLFQPLPYCPLFPLPSSEKLTHALFSKFSLLPLGSFLCSMFLSWYWRGKGLLLVWDSQKRLKNSAGIFVFLSSGFVRPSLSLTLQPPLLSVLLGLYRARRVVTGSRLRVDHH